jgi:hypothetical protein
MAPRPGHQPRSGKDLREVDVIVAGVVIETLPGRAPRVALRIGASRGLRLAGGDGDRHLAAVVEAGEGRTLEAWADDLLTSDEEIVGVFPTFVGDDAE